MGATHKKHKISHKTTRGRNEEEKTHHPQTGRQPPRGLKAAESPTDSPVFQRRLQKRTKKGKIREFVHSTAKE